MPPLYLVLVAEGRFRVWERGCDVTPNVSAWLEIAREAAPFGGDHQELPMAARLPGYHEERQSQMIEWLVRCVENFMTPRTGEEWIFAASPDLHGPVLEALLPSIRATLAESLLESLIDAPGDEIAGRLARVRSSGVVC
jgi:hypothetical protein